MTLEPCPGCGGLFPRREGFTHPYLESSPGCAEACGRLFAQHYEQMEIYGDVYRLANDAYAVQHPGQPSRQTINSAGIHLIRLCLTIEHSLPAKHANAAVLAAGQRKEDYWWLEPPAFKGSITVADFVEAMPREEHRWLLRRWAESAWEAWAEHHETIRQWLPAKWRCHTAEPGVPANGSQPIRLATDSRSSAAGARRRSLRLDTSLNGSAYESQHS